MNAPSTTLGREPGSTDDDTVHTFLGRSTLPVAGLLIGLTAGEPATADPARDVLWAAVKTCVFAKKATGRTFPCLSVDLGDREHPGTAVLRAPGEPTHVVVMPTDTVSGLEAPILRGARGAAYWRAALGARHFVSDAVKRAMPAAEVGLAVNSEDGRSQDQLHIHLDCMRPSVLAAMKGHGRSVRGTWMPLPALPGGHYLAMRVPAAEVDRFNPFAALTRLPGRRDLRRTSFAALATSPDDPDPGILLFAVRGDGAHAEELMDHACTTAGKAAAH